MAFHSLRDELYCSICLNTYKEPVTLKCGHNFCFSCITSVASEKEIVHACPQCRERLDERLVFRRNINLGNIAECFRFTQPEKEESDIFCSYCLQHPVPAVKSCTHCDASLCNDHLKVHSKSEEHFFVEPKTSAEDRECSVHKKLLKYYCSEDDLSLCAECRLDEEHVGHKMGPVNVAYKKKKDELTSVQDKLVSRKEETSRRLQKLYQHQTEAQEEPSRFKLQINDLFKAIREQLKSLENRLWTEFLDYSSNVLQSVSQQIKDLEKQEKTLSCMVDDLKLLQNKMDPLVFLREWKANRDSFYEALDPKRDKDFPEVVVLNEAQIAETIHIGLRDLFIELKKMMYAPSDVTLDVDTAGNGLDVSHNLKRVSRSTMAQSRPDSPERFQCLQVISRNVFASGRHFWDVETSESGFWMVGVCYPSMDRKECQPCIGSNTKSWCLSGYNGQYSARHNGTITPLQPVTSARMRIFLLYDAGRLSFYELGDKFKHLHTFKVTFTEPLHAAFWVWDGTVTIRNDNEFCVFLCD
ncbi:hypothetical protein GDO81_025045 [Engystomops pustulosus]|uniref:Uncharacterized protein n=1 Tax=Engystomops pustulosus TaxID=76066 RepID=A0AAV6ZGG6_ENGPU|nr:hypothetical protein GDO81_025045 [Engystomops pustulosus]